MRQYIQNLDENSAINLTRKLKEIELQDNEFDFKIDDFVTCTPLGMILISNSIKEFRELNPNSNFKMSINKNSEHIKYAGHMGFFKNISKEIDYGRYPGEITGNDKYIPITKINFKTYKNNYLYSHMMPIQYIEYEANRLSKVLAQNNKELEMLFTYLIREILRNSEEHGKVDSALICAQFWKSRNIAEIAILDRGIGYKESLRKKFEKLDNDEDAIRLALKPGISESYFNKYSQEEENSGFGLYVASEICNALDGSFSIISGNIMIKRSNNTMTVSTGHHNGSAIKMLLHTDKIFNFQDLISRIVRDGENEIREKGINIKASELSKGKFLYKQ